MCGQSWTERGLGRKQHRGECLGNLMCHLCLHGRKCWQHQQKQQHKKKNQKTSSETDSAITGKMSIYLLIYSNFVSFRFGVVWFISIFDCISFVLLSCPAIHSHEIKTYHLNFICIGKQQEDDRENEKERDGEMEGIPISWPNKSTWGPRVIVSPAEIVFIVAEIVA